MKQPLSELIQIFQAVENGADWEYENTAGEWKRPKPDYSIMSHAATFRIRIKPKPFFITGAVCGRRGGSAQDTATIEIRFHWTAGFDALPQLGTKFEIRQIIED